MNERKDSVPACEHQSGSRRRDGEREGSGIAGRRGQGTRAAQRKAALAGQLQTAGTNGAILANGSARSAPRSDARRRAVRQRTPRETSENTPNLLPARHAAWSWACATHRVRLAVAGDHPRPEVDADRQVLNRLEALVGELLEQA